MVRGGRIYTTADHSSGIMPLTPITGRRAPSRRDDADRDHATNAQASGRSYSHRAVDNYVGCISRGELMTTSR